MKTKQVKEMIDILSSEVKVNDIDKSFLSLVPEKPVVKEKLRFKRILFPLILGTSLAVIVISLIVVGLTQPIFPDRIEKGEITETKKKLAFQAIGCFTLIDNLSSTTKLTNSTESKVKEEIEEYLSLADTYLNKNDLVIESLTSDDENYEYKYRFDLKKDVYLYFNETRVNDYDDGDIDEVSSIVEGYILSGDTKYYVSGEKEVEGKEIETKFRTYYSDNYYIEVEQEIENGENGYEFKYYKDNKLVKEFSIEIEEQIGSAEVEIEERIGSAEVNGGDNKSFEFILSNSKIYVEVDIPSLYQGEVIININNDEYSYEFKD